MKVYAVTSSVTGCVGVCANAESACLLLRGAAETMEQPSGSRLVYLGRDLESLAPDADAWNALFMRDGKIQASVEVTAQDVILMR